MQRTLDPAQIEAFAERSFPRVRLSDPAILFSRRAQRLRTLAEQHSLGDYLRLMAAVADTQQIALNALVEALKSAQFAQQFDKQIELAHMHRMPVLQAAGWPRQPRWRGILKDLCAEIAGAPGFPAGVQGVC